MAAPRLEVLTPQNSQIIFIDHQPQMAFGVQSIERQVLKTNTVALAKAAKVFQIPTTITSVELESFSGHTYPELLNVFPDMKVLERTSMNSWDDRKVRDALKANGRNKVVVSGLWTGVCNNTFALSAMRDVGYVIYTVADASGGTSKEAHDYAMQRLIFGFRGAGGVPSEDYILHRLLLSSDLHLGPDVRIFVQLGDELEAGRLPGPQPTDRDKGDPAQGFFEFQLPVDADATIGGRIGRQEMMYGSNRLVDIREGPNTRRWCIKK
jgi:nicotinamidase-related amidase